MYEAIRRGKEIKTQDGYIVIGGYNGYAVEVECYTVDEDGNESLTDTGEWTLEEIAHEMKAVDGKRHFLIYDNSITCPECPYWWKDEGEAWHCCHFDRSTNDLAPCEE